jgi:hypothetical protein
MAQCVACGDDAEFFNVACVPCQHEYCRSCLEALFKASITDESLFPPRCCRQPINLSTARLFLKSDLVHLYEKKKIEFETPNRTYCYSTFCLHWGIPYRWRSSHMPRLPAHDLYKLQRASTYGRLSK